LTIIALYFLKLKNKKTMKKLLYSTMMVGALAFGVTSCTKTCDPGYEGSDCKTEIRAKYVADYLVSGTDTDGDTYTNIPVQITASSTDVQKVLIKWDNVLTFSGEVGDTKITIPSQTVSGATFSGQATLNGSTLTLQIVVAGTGGYTINASGDKQ
jgi:hypothetical protein